MKFTHDLDTNLGWIETTENPSNFEKVKHLGKCAIDGDMFAVYDDGSIHIFKGTMEEEENLKTNTWYRHKEVGFFVYRTGDENNYAIDFNGDEYFSFICSRFNLWKEATDEEIENALIKVAKKKGFKDIDKLTLKDFDGQITNKGFFNFSGNNYSYYNGKLFLDGATIFKDGEWREIIEEELSLEERLKRIEEKLNI